MNVGDLQILLSDFDTKLNGKLISCDIISAMDGQHLAGVNSNITLSTMFSEITMYLKNGLEAGALPPVKDYYLLNLEDNINFIVGELPDNLLCIAVINEEHQDFIMKTLTEFINLLNDIRKII